MGFRWRACTPAALAGAGLLGVAYAALNYSIIGPLLARLLGERPDLSGFAVVRQSLGGYPIAVALECIIGGFYEEPVFRGFIQTTLLRRLPA